MATNDGKSGRQYAARMWAQLGRCHRVIGKYIDDSPDIEARAEEAFRRALELNPRLSLAHKFYAQLEADIGPARSKPGDCCSTCARRLAFRSFSRGPTT